MEYYQFIHLFRKRNVMRKIYNDSLELDEYYIKVLNNSMVEGNTLRALRLLEGIEDVFRRDRIMNRVLNLPAK